MENFEASGTCQILQNSDVASTMNWAWIHRNVTIQKDDVHSYQNTSDRHRAMIECAMTLLISFFFTVFFAWLPKPFLLLQLSFSHQCVPKISVLEHLPLQF